MASRSAFVPAVAMAGVAMGCCFLGAGVEGSARKVGVAVDWVLGEVLAGKRRTRPEGSQTSRWP